MNIRLLHARATLLDLLMIMSTIDIMFDGYDYEPIIIMSSRARRKRVPEGLIIRDLRTSAHVPVLDIRA
ncbi:hypothetical protein H0H93_009219 [Arthromyces matolae]|nr:hypothetical protein H0H93_009219 [Arthromyces matolae]